ncbi:hypothetical protein NMY22_g20316 [Coprinellus aureogranulatus]|nr:hypothetical protein NMY22_g20316 [Coprinellus aureogranulatus]
MTCGHTFCGPCLYQRFETELRKTLTRLRHLSHVGHRADACQAIPRTEEERQHLEECLIQHGLKPEWTFQYLCPDVMCGSMISVPPAVDRKLQGVLIRLLETLRGRFHPPVYKPDARLPTPLFSGLFIIRAGQEL